MDRVYWFLICNINNILQDCKQEYDSIIQNIQHNEDNLNEIIKQKRFEDLREKYISEIESDKKKLVLIDSIRSQYYERLIDATDMYNLQLQKETIQDFKKKGLDYLIEIPDGENSLDKIQ